MRSSHPVLIYLSAGCSERQASPFSAWLCAHSAIQCKCKSTDKAFLTLRKKMWLLIWSLYRLHSNDGSLYFNRNFSWAQTHSILYLGIVLNLRINITIPNWIKHFFYFFFHLVFFEIKYIISYWKRKPHLCSHGYTAPPTFVRKHPYMLLHALLARDAGWLIGKRLLWSEGAWQW